MLTSASRMHSADLRRASISPHETRFYRPSRWRRSDESVLHEGFRFLAGPADHLEGSLIEGVSGLRLPRDSLFHRLECDGGGLPRKHVDLIHRGHDVRLVEAFFLRDLRELRGPAMHISSVMVRARTSRVPRKILGRPRLLFTWFGKSDRPVAMTRAPASAASQGQISGTGFAITKRMASSAMEATQSFWITPGPGFEAAMVTSASRIASATPPSRSSPFVLSASSHFSAYSFAATSISSRWRQTIPFESTRMRCSGFAPAEIRSFAVRMFDATAPTSVMAPSGILLPPTLSALMRPATLIVAVPCWSSCHTAILHSFRSRCRM